MMPLLNPTKNRTCTILNNKHVNLGARNPGVTRQKHDGCGRAHQILTRWPSRADCSPYDVLEQPRNGPYSKRRFYELVMVYHPDRWIHHGTYHGIPKKTRIERYRLVLAANAILSDPVRRKAYDERGVGWGLSAAEPSRGAQAQSGKGSGGGRGYSYYGNSRSNGSAKAAAAAAAAGQDAEDWWGQPSPRGSSSQQRPIFMCNHRFALMLLSLATALSYALWSAALGRAKLVSTRQNSIHRQLVRDLDSIRLGRSNPSWHHP